MKHLLKYLLAAAVLPLWGQAAADGPFGQLRGLCEPGKSVLLTAPTVVEGIVVSDYRSPNMELNPNLNYFSVDLEENDRTAYVEAADGSAGIRLRFDEASENRLARYDRVRLDLNGCRLTRTASPDCMTLTGVQALNVLSVAPGTAADLPLKERTVATLTDDDLYTFVTLRDAEFVFKEGSYTNIWEPYAQSCGELHHYKYDINNRMDGWASLVRDAEGGTIYMLVNTLCAWRRAGKPLPQGMGPLSGVVVHTPMRRYGGDMGRYSIRPLDEGDIAVGRKRNSPWKRLTGWLLDGSAGASLEFELLGYQNLGTEGRKGDRVLSDAGSSRGYLGPTAALSCTSTATTTPSGRRTRDGSATARWSSRPRRPTGTSGTTWGAWSAQTPSTSLFRPKKPAARPCNSPSSGAQATRTAISRGTSRWSGRPNMRSTAASSSLSGTPPRDAGPSCCARCPGGTR